MDFENDLRIFEKFELILVVCVGAILFTIAVPLHHAVLDICLAVNLLLSIIIFIFCILFKNEAYKFLKLPLILIFVTLFRMFLNIGFTKLLFLNKDTGLIIHKVGEFLVGNHYIAGLRIFAILAFASFIVIFYGVKRFSEQYVRRFTLDRMPGIQLGIDADLNAGLISEAEAWERRKDLENKVDFYGIMDEASRFIKLDAIIGFSLTILNICGGLLYGIKILNMDLSSALATYSILVAGAVIVYQIPALLIMASVNLATVKITQDKKKTEKNSKCKENEMNIEINTIEIQLSSDLVPLLGEFNLSKQIAKLRWQMQKDASFELPSIRVRDNLLLAHDTYVIKVAGYEIEHEAILDKNDYNKTAEEIINTLANTINSYVSTKQSIFDLNIQIGHEFNDTYKILLYHNRPEVHFLNGEDILFTFKLPETCPETLDELKELKLSQNCNDEQLEILLKWFKSNATTKVLGRVKEWSNYEDLIILAHGMRKDYF